MKDEVVRELPPGWRYLSVGDALKLRNGRAFKSSEWATQGLPVIRIQNLKTPDAPFNYYDGDLPDQFKARSGDVLFAWSGTPGTSFGAHIWQGGEAWVNQHIFRVDFSPDEFDAAYLRLALNDNVASYIDQAQGGVGLAHITKKKLDASTLIAPPLEVQRRIVTWLADAARRRTTAQGHIDHGEALLAAAKGSLLSAACSGRLTAGWREANGSAPAVAVTQPTRRPRHFWSIEQFDLELTPDSWQWVQVDDLLPARGIFDGPFGSNLKSSDYTETGARVVRLENIGHLVFHADKRSFVSPEKYESLLKHAVRAGDIVFSSFVDEKVRVCVLPRDIDDLALAKADCFTLRPSDVVLPEYLVLQLTCRRTYEALSSAIHGGDAPPCQYNTGKKSTYSGVLNRGARGDRADV